MLKSAKKLPDAQKVLHAAIDRDPRNTSLERDLIHVEAEIDGLAAGLAAARDFAKSDPDNSLYDVVSAELYEKAGRSEEAAGTIFGRVTALCPTERGGLTAEQILEAWLSTSFKGAEHARRIAMIAALERGESLL